MIVNGEVQTVTRLYAVLQHSLQYVAAVWPVSVSVWATASLQVHLQIPNTVYTGHSWSLTQWIEPSSWKQRLYRKDTLLETKMQLPLV